MVGVSHLGEPVEEGLGQPLATAALREGVLAAEDLGLLVLHVEPHAQLRDEDLRPVVEAGVQPLQHGLGGQIQLQTAERRTESEGLSVFLTQRTKSELSNFSTKSEGTRSGVLFFPFI